MFSSRSSGETSYRIVTDWRHQSICKGEDPDLFFPVGNTGIALLQIEEAKAVCRRCPVMESCADWALDTGQDSGVWGGLSEDERRAIKRRLARQRTAAASSKQKTGAQS
ncbi:WhiB family transcriptional regulator [Streptomyces sp. AC1-42T]|uniref:WhiB family transcriptional regulator n=1 Tax=Streptomyces sp. AC1-42T TaxID=2218665 RepID=UPI000DAEC364|nr:WhiB family transcriptional regulator [Streptomyces sp. AC1-42T]PZT71590.1 WhiB family transcriptional regulator [Streptomyces sp. AC1-42T]